MDYCWADRRLGHRQDYEGSGYGALTDILLGIAGAIIGGWIMRRSGGTGQGGMIYTILVAILGAVVLTLIFRAITGKRTEQRNGRNPKGSLGNNHFGISIQPRASFGRARRIEAEC